MRIPPFLGIYLHPIELHAEVNMIATGHPGLSAQSHDLSLFHHVSVVHIDSAEVPVDGLETVAMIEDNAVAVDAKRSRIDDLPIIGGLHSYVLRNRQIVSEVNLLVDLLSVINVVPNVRETRLGLGMSLPDERPRPQEPVGGSEAQIRKSLIVAAAHFAVAPYEPLDWVTGTVRIEFTHNLLQKCVAHL
jgi:hypothetical protein